MNYEHIKACVQYSGGLMSWGCAKLAVDKFGADNVLLLFADTGVESDGTYRFILQGANALGCSLVLVRTNPQGKYITPWDIAAKHDFIPSWNRPICSAYLKQKPLQKWIKQNLSKDCLIVIGFSIEEYRRIERMKKSNVYKNLWFPLADRPYTTVCDIRKWLEEYGIAESDLYEKGANHANCNGACFQANKGTWAWLYKTNKPLFMHYAEKEEAFNIGKDPRRTILRRRNEPYSLKELAADIEAGIVQPTFSRLPCACGVPFYQEKFNFDNE
jgi:3'-phosphoadenosine 5'-phosphosulfate sulfotransferase (PAPS reductase)/FAD synthetase